MAQRRVRLAWGSGGQGEEATPLTPPIEELIFVSHQHCPTAPFHLDVTVWIMKPFETHTAFDPHNVCMRQAL